MKANRVFIYGLIDPATGQVRYVGKTTDMARRLRRHLKDARDGKSDHKSRWIACLLREGRFPVLTTLEECPRQAWKARECWWIAYYRAQGVDLTNAKDGGDGAEPGEETRAKMSAAKQGKPAHNRGKATPEVARRKQSEAAKRRWERRTPEEKEAVIHHLLSHAGTGKPGWHHSEDARAKISATLKGNKRTLGYKASEETRRRQSEARKGHRFTQEVKDKIGMAKARFSPEQVQEIRRLLAEGVTQKVVAERFGVHRVTISRIQHGQSYRYYD